MGGTALIAEPNLLNRKQMMQNGSEPNSPPDRFIKKLLSDGNNWTVYELEMETGYSDRAIKQHLKNLVEYGIVIKEPRKKENSGDLPALYRMNTQ